MIYNFIVGDIVKLKGIAPFQDNLDIWLALKFPYRWSVKIWQPWLHKYILRSTYIV